MPLRKVEITKYWSDTSEVVGYAEGKLNGREFTASWAAWCPFGAIFYDTWFDSTAGQTTAIARALAKVGAVPSPHLP